MYLKILQIEGEQEREELRKQYSKKTENSNFRSFSKASGSVLKCLGKRHLVCLDIF